MEVNDQTPVQVRDRLELTTGGKTVNMFRRMFRYRRVEPSLEKLAGREAM